MKYISLLFLLCFGLSIMSSCHHDKFVEPEIEDDCLAKFPTDNPGIIGAWEMVEFTDIATGVTTAFDDNIGFMVGNRYCDAFEIRENLEFDVYYKRSGRFCQDRKDGTWEYDQDSLVFNFIGERVALEVLTLDGDTLIIKDIIDFIPQIAKMERASE